MSIEEKMSFDLSIHVHRYVSEQIRFADTKAAVLLGVHGALMAWDLSQVRAVITKMDPGWPVPLVFFILAAVPLGLGYYYALDTIAPRLIRPKATGEVFWEHILSHKELDRYLGALKVDFNKALDILGSSNWDLAQIASRKYAGVRSSVWLLSGSILGLLLGLVMDIILGRVVPH